MRVNRRAFLRVAGVAVGAAAGGGIPAMVAAQKAPSFPKGTRLSILEWVSFVPASDVEFRRLATEFGKLAGDRKSTRLNSSHGYISYAVFCLKKKKEEPPARDRHRAGRLE